MFMVDVHYKPVGIHAPKIERKEFEKIEGAIRYQESFWDQPGVARVVILLKTADRLFVLVPGNLFEKVLPMLM